MHRHHGYDVLISAFHSPCFSFPLLVPSSPFRSPSSFHYFLIPPRFSRMSLASFTLVAKYDDPPLSG